MANEKYAGSVAIQQLITKIKTEMATKEEAFGDMVVKSVGPADVVSFSDGADDIPVKSLVADIDPVQDLHGQSAPYPAGGSKNIYGVTATTETINDVTFTVNKDAAGNVLSVTTSGTASADAVFTLGVKSLPAGSYIMSGCPSGGSNSTYYLREGGTAAVNDVGSGKDFTFSEQSPANLKINIKSGVNASGLVFKPMVCLSTATDPDYAHYVPYSNICPISGWTGAKITRTGKNFCPYGTETFTRYSSQLPLDLPAGTYTISALVTSSDTDGNSCRLNITDKDGYTLVTDYFTRNARTSVTFTLTKEAGSIRFFAARTSNAGEGDTATWADIQIEEGSTATTYEAYNGKSVVIDICINQWDEEWESGAITLADGQNASSATKIRSKNYIPVEAGKTYWVDFKTSDCALFFYDENKTYKGSSYVVSKSESGSVLISSGVSFMRFSIAQTTYVDTNRISINYPASFTGYYPYTGRGVVYGGTLNVTTGVLTVTKKGVDLGTLDWSSGTVLYYADLPETPVVPTDNTTPPDAICSRYAAKSYNTVLANNIGINIRTSNGRVYIYDNTVADLSALETALNGETLVYLLATPQTYQLTPTEVATLLGDNNIFADCGGVEVDYRVEPSVAMDEEISKKVPDAPAEAGTYVLKVTVVEGSDPEYAWEASE